MSFDRVDRHNQSLEEMVTGVDLFYTNLVAKKALLSTHFGLGRFGVAELKRWLVYTLDWHGQCP